MSYPVFFAFLLTTFLPLCYTVFAGNSFPVKTDIKNTQYLQGCKGLNLNLSDRKPDYLTILCSSTDKSVSN